MHTTPPVHEALNAGTPFAEILSRRRATRAYRPTVVTEPRVRALLEAAVRAPTAMDREPWEFVVVQDCTLLHRISEKAKSLARAHAAAHGNMLKEPGSPGDGIASQLADPSFDIFHDAGTLVVICARPTPKYLAPDLGTCCIGLAVPALNDPDVKAELRIPAEVDAIAPIIVGVPAGGLLLAARNPPVVLNWIR
jgi:nitroreductase